MTSLPRPHKEGPTRPDRPASVPARPTLDPAAAVDNGAAPSSVFHPTAWPRRTGMFLGSLVLRLCSDGRKECTRNCWLQPVCACARADLEAASRVETRVWITIAICGAAVIALALIRASTSAQ